MVDILDYNQTLYAKQGYPTYNPEYIIGNLNIAVTGRVNELELVVEELDLGWVDDIVPGATCIDASPSEDLAKWEIAIVEQISDTKTEIEISYCGSGKCASNILLF